MGPCILTKSIALSKHDHQQQCLLATEPMLAADLSIMHSIRDRPPYLLSANRASQSPSIGPHSGRTTTPRRQGRRWRVGCTARWRGPLRHAFVTWWVAILTEQGGIVAISWAQFDLFSILDLPEVFLQNDLSVGLTQPIQEEFIHFHFEDGLEDLWWWHVFTFSTRHSAKQSVGNDRNVACNKQVCSLLT